MTFWDPDTSPQKKGGGFWVLKPTSVRAQVKSPTGPSATEEEGGGNSLLVRLVHPSFMYKMGNSFDTETRNSLPSYEDSVKKVGQMYTNFTILLSTLAAHTSTWWWFRWFISLYIFFLFIVGFLTRFLVPETIIHTLLWGLDLILPALQDCDAWPWCSLAGRQAGRNY